MVAVLMSSAGAYLVHPERQAPCHQALEGAPCSGPLPEAQAWQRAALIPHHLWAHHQVGFMEAVKCAQPEMASARHLFRA